MFDKIKPIFSIDSDKEKLILQIEEKLSSIKIDDNDKKNNLKIKSRVRSIHSSLAIESNSLSLEAVSNIIDNKMVLGKPYEIQEVKNANELYKKINDYNYKNEDDFIDAHMVMMKYFEDDNGLYRNLGEAIKRDNEIIFIAPNSIVVPALMKSLFEFLNDNENKIHPLILSSIFHYYFVYIHPFTDGNGRIVRFWVSLILICYNYKFEYIPIEEEIYLNQEEYYNSISECHNNGNVNVFIDFMLKIINNCLEKLPRKLPRKNLMSH